MLITGIVLGKIKGGIIRIKGDERDEYATFEDFKNNCGEYDDVASISAEGDKVVLEIVDREKEIKADREAFMKKWEEEHGPWFSPYGY